jgi:predicted GNAT family N-acyltransferase
VNQLKIKQVETKQEYEQILNIRKKVFIEEQKVPKDIEIDEYETESTHFILYLNKKPIGCARIRLNNFAKLERIAILKKHRRNGFGKRLTEFLIDYCHKKNIFDIRLNSQLSVANFYEKIGFKKVGQVFFEAGIKHVEMFLENP